MFCRAVTPFRISRKIAVENDSMPGWMSTNPARARFWSCANDRFALISQASWKRRS
jgi:hypothetical protein